MQELYTHRALGKGFFGSFAKASQTDQVREITEFKLNQDGQLQGF